MPPHCLSLPIDNLHQLRRFFLLFLLFFGMTVLCHGCHLGGHEEDDIRGPERREVPCLATSLQNVGQARESGFFAACALFTIPKPCNNAG